MNDKIFNLVVSKLTDEIEALKKEIKDLKIEVSALKLKKSEQIIQTETKNQTDDELLDIFQVRKILKVSRNSVLRMVKEGVLRAVRIHERTIRYAKSDVLKLIRI